MMNGQAANKQGSGKVLWVFVGVAFIGVGCYYESTTFVIAGIICVILAFVGKKKNNAVSTEIRSGATQNMPANMTVTAASTIRSGSLNAYTYHKGIERTDHCPICREFSGNGYCSKCGYRFNK